jgi:hypothetical protein
MLLSREGSCEVICPFTDVSNCSHTIEEMQSTCIPSNHSWLAEVCIIEFSNSRTPSPPWVHVVRTMVPLSSCDEAAPYLIKALGGEDVARQVVGGVKWWQVRGVDGLVLVFLCQWNFVSTLSVLL